MASLLDRVEAPFATLYAIVAARQAGVAFASAPSFATSGVGAVRLRAGTQHADGRITAERWDARPPDLDGWDDIDELPFEELPGGGGLEIGGFDASGIALDVAGLGGGRVEVRARGRRRRGRPGSPVVEETWLLRIHPVDGAHDPMAGGPRRISAGGGLHRGEGSPWQRSLYSWSTEGWRGALYSSPGFRLAEEALHAAGGPVTSDDLAARMLTGLRRSLIDRIRLARVDHQLTDAQMDAAPAAVPVPPAGLHNEGADRLAEAAGVDALRTIGEVIDALRWSGLLLVERRAGRELLIANPVPEPAWERLEMTEPERAWLRARALDHLHGGVAEDIVAAVAWSGPSGLRATPDAMATRWAARTDQVTAALRMLAGAGRLDLGMPFGFDSVVEGGAELVLRATPAADLD